MDPLQQLTAIFGHFPGVGPRQAQRFVQYLLRLGTTRRRNIADAILKLGTDARRCPLCMRFHVHTNLVCALCGNAERDTSTLALVADDIDIVALERSNSFRGRYFVLGGTLIFGSEKEHNLRINELLASLPSREKEGLREIILSFPAHPEGDATASFVEQHIRDAGHATIKITSLGRGLSTGSELEYADPDTLRNALDNRK